MSILDDGSIRVHDLEEGKGECLVCFFFVCTDETHQEDGRQQCTEAGQAQSPSQEHHSQSLFSECMETLRCLVNGGTELKIHTVRIHFPVHAHTLLTEVEAQHCYCFRVWVHFELTLSLCQVPESQFNVNPGEHLKRQVEADHLSPPGRVVVVEDETPVLRHRVQTCGCADGIL